MKDEIMIILFVAAIASLAIGIAFPEEGHESTGWIEGAAILVAVLAVSSVMATLDYHQDLKFREMNAKEKDKMVKVVRGGEPQEVNIAELCVGDVVDLSAGDQIPADGIILRADELTVDESTMTGEVLPVRKVPNSVRMMMLCGTHCNKGRGYMLVLSVGEHSQWGAMLKELVQEHEETPLQKKLGKMAVNIGWVGLAVAIAVFVVLMIYWSVEAAEDFETDDLREILEFFIISITIIAVAVPEGLPLAVTISLAYSMKQMYKDNNFVRHLRACETMGGATDICSDKTGTLTENRMTLTAGWIAGQQFDTVPMNIDLNNDIETLVHQNICLNSTGEFTVDDNGKYVFRESATECAMLVFSDKQGVSYRDMRKDIPLEKMFLFSSDRKKSSAVIKEGDHYRVHVKGAPEWVLEDCVDILTADGKVAKLETEVKEEMKEYQRELMGKGWRTLALATRTLDEFDHDESTPPEFNLTFVALFGIEDPIRPEVPRAVRDCETAGVTVRMVTGDAILTAKTIAEEAGILTADGYALEGDAFRVLTYQEVDEILPTLQVIARCQPLDKLRLVKRLKHHKQIVGVTGDGTNDAPALKQAHVGLSMGIAGTDVAKQASDIVILDDNFDSIVRAVSWGRCIFDNIRKFLQFQLTVNLSALVVAFIGAITQKGSPMRAIQLLWVNLIMDTLAALALGTERPTPDLLLRPPINIRQAWLLSNIMLKNILGQGLYQIALLCFILYLGPFAWDTRDESLHHYTLIFNAFVWATLWNEINSRKVNGEQNVFSGLTTNWVFIAVIVFTIAVQILVVEFGGVAFQTAPLSWDEWIATMLIGLGSLPIGALLRLMPVPKYDGFGFARTEQFSWPEKRVYNVPGPTKEDKKDKKKGDDNRVDDYDDKGANDKAIASTSGLASTSHDKLVVPANARDSADTSTSYSSSDVDL
mmetsp:Transcript_18345/g.27311  ORF Transcript_18345/g.27311 Transcript_18345/m.27311 type:complete len:932 (+) Transcript_18345:1-2796(+)